MKRHGRNFTCVYPDAKNVHLVKDIGMVANVLARSHGYESHFVCLDRGREFTYLEDEARWLKVDLLEDDPGYKQFRWPPRSAMRYLVRNSHRIDVLQLYNHTRETMLLGLIYKFLNPKGFFYLKLDANEPWLLGECVKKESSRKEALVEYLLPHLFARAIPDLLTSESVGSLEAYRRLYPWSSDRLKLLPNGFDDAWFAREGLEEIFPAQKENLAITVGRIGTHQKHSEMLLDALERCDLGDWRFALLGSIEPDFQVRIDELFERRPELRGKVLFPGEIRDRRELYGWYARAKVFCMTSRWEGFSLALVDALHFGCHIVSTRVSSIDDVLDHGAIGAIVDGETELVQELSSLFQGTKDPMDSFDAVRAHSRKFRWSDLCARLAGWIDGNV